jgi:creatinine amidohydrolase/Fe(II)-dependent formamide hydrolase-like protein
MVMAVAPELVRMQDLALDPAPVLRRMIAHPDNYQRAQKVVDDAFVIPRMTQRPDVKVGVMGRPEQATPARGRMIVNATVAAVSRKIRELESKADGIYRDVRFTPAPLLLKQY